MYNYITGEIKEIKSNYVVIENNNIGYQIFVGNPYVYKENEKYTIYLYNYIREDEYSLYGFGNKEERELFLRLINVKGLGPKMALPMVSTGSVSAVIDAIERENLLYLTKFPKVGDKVARQIILDLKGKLADHQDLFAVNDLDELVSVLESLGYKKADIKKILPQVDATKGLEDQVKEALKLLLNYVYCQNENKPDSHRIVVGTQIAI